MRHLLPELPRLLVASGQWLGFEGFDGNPGAGDLIAGESRVVRWVRSNVTSDLVTARRATQRPGYEMWLDAGAVAEDNCKPTGYNAGLSVAGTIPCF